MIHASVSGENLHSSNATRENQRVHQNASDRTAAEGVARVAKPRPDAPKTTD